ncbi:MAG: Arylsulfatase [Candidatus Hydrogenedentes bacterium ADurb.Bin101]|jgi:arylsulfatase A-like enzyme|nr:MAG: Arylsulfatase [Candidatus Hydrogenedentes bacterium ADurb.Bin101]HOC68460.1 sulfatase-like hydrolase/transferase [Candidatus Hydrogenedentota bacterium]
MKRRAFLERAAGAAAILPFLPIGATVSAPTRTDDKKPNLVWIWCDNLAYGDLGCYGNQAIKTPVIDSLAQSGTRLTQYYIAHTVCSPSRAALLTGRQPFRTGIVDVLRPDSPTGMPDDEITLGDALRAEGYATAAIGKWHLGDRREYLPLQHGFDHYFGLPYSMDMLPTILYRDNDIIERLPGDKVQNITERYIDDAISFVETHQDRPFFLYFNHTLPHPPVNLPQDCRTPGRSIYEDAIEHIDRQTGRLLERLDALGLSENTLVVFSSDNGPMGEHGDTRGLRGRIRDSYEGGVRVPLIARWPGKIPAGVAVDTPAISYDIFPTFLALAGGKLAEDRVYDGQDIWPLLSGAGAVRRRAPFFWVYLDNVTAMRDGQWKLHVAHRDKALDAPELYDVEADPKEAHPVNQDQPDILERMLAQVKAFEAEIPKVWTLQYPVRDPEKRKSGVRRE